MNFKMYSSALLLFFIQFTLAQQTINYLICDDFKLINHFPANTECQIEFQDKKQLNLVQAAVNQQGTETLFPRIYGEFPENGVDVAAFVGCTNRPNLIEKSARNGVNEKSYSKDLYLNGKMKNTRIVTLKCCRY